MGFETLRSAIELPFPTGIVRVLGEDLNDLFTWPALRTGRYLLQRDNWFVSYVHQESPDEFNVGISDDPSIENGHELMVTIKRMDNDLYRLSSVRWFRQSTRTSFPAYALFRFYRRRANSSPAFTVEMISNRAGGEKGDFALISKDVVKLIARRYADTSDVWERSWHG